MVRFHQIFELLFDCLVLSHIQLRPRRHSLRLLRVDYEVNEPMLQWFEILEIVRCSMRGRNPSRHVLNKARSVLHVRLNISKWHLLLQQGELCYPIFVRDHAMDEGPYTFVPDHESPYLPHTKSDSINERHRFPLLIP